MNTQRLLLCLFLCLASAPRARGQTTATAPSPPAPSPWQIGAPDDSAAEFGDYRTAAVEQITIGPDGKPRPPAASISKGLRAASNPAMEIAFDLAAVPEHGALFSFKLLNASRSGGQMAVYSNRLLAGLIQLWGTAGTDSPYRWMKTYRLYVPREMLAPGRNVLRLEAVRPLYSDPADPGLASQLWWEWDYLKLEPLAEPALEPVHGCVSYLGTTLKHSANDFLVNDDTVRLAPAALQWMGVAWSGNTIRCDFWYDVTGSQPRRLQYLQTLRDLNLTAVVDYVSGSHFHNDPDGRMPAKVRTDLEHFLTEYGSLFQFYELGNEPCMFGGGYAETMNLARFLDRAKPANVTVAACGWAYGGGKGTPVNWDADAALRRNVEALCGATNGHSYGYSYADNRGGSFVENLATWAGVEDGWPLDSINTETGTNNWHSEENGTRFKSAQPHAQAFDRILRAHLAVVERTMQHAAVFEDFGLFQPPADWSDPTTLRAFPGVGNEDTRLKTYRRLALAYATHGAPLAWSYTNRAEVEGQKVYFRAVDTAALPALPGSGGTSDKVLLNFVNFDDQPRRLAVRVAMPLAGDWHGDRFGPGDTFPAARSDAALHVGTEVELAEALGPGESVQYVLTPPGAARPYPPQRLRAEPGDGRVALAWAAVRGASRYEVKRATDGGPFAVAGNVTEPGLADAGLKNGSVVRYVVRAVNERGAGDDSSPVEVRVGVPARPGPVTATAGDRRGSLVWTASERAESYAVARADRLAGPFKVIADRVAAASFDDPDVANGSQYFYTVRPANAAGPGEASPAVRVVPHAPPAAPAEVSALAADGRVVLEWKRAGTGAGGARADAAYTVARSLSPAGPFAPVVAGLMATHYADDAPNGRTWYYVVSAVDPDAPASAGAASAPVPAAPAAGPLPAPWSQADVGRVGRPGAATVAPGGVFTVQGAGNDVWGDADAVYFVSQPLADEATLTARVAAFDDTHAWAKVGLMVRASNDPAAPMAVIAVTPGSGVSFTHRDAPAGPCAQDGGPARPWLRLARHGDEVTAFTSPDGKAWQRVGSAKAPLGPGARAGLAVCSHNEGRLNKAVFDHVTVEPGK